MLKKLKYRFILINMALVGAIMLIVFGATLYLTCRSQADDVEKMLNSAIQLYERHRVPEPDASNEGIPPEPFDKEEFNRQLPLKVVTVKLGADEEIIDLREYGMSMEEDTLRHALREIRNDRRMGDERLGYVSGSGLLYVQREVIDQRYVAFTSAELLESQLRNAAIIYGGCLLLSLVLFFFVSYLLAAVAIRPIDRAWKQQKRFVADASHDLKTPLTVIMANIDILRSHKDETVASQLQWIDSADEEARGMRGLCEQLLELARTEDARQQSEPSEVGMSDLCEQICLQLEPLAFDKSVEVVTDIEENITLNTDREACVRIIHILMDNAIKYSSCDEKVYLSLRRERHGASISVRNYGSVIPREELPHIFERFYRADRSRAVGGHGLGLSIAKKLVDSIGGRITVSSDAKNGTVFTVYLKNT